MPGADNTTSIVTTPEEYWTTADEQLVIPTDYSLCVGFAIQTGTLFLLQCFWQYLVNSVVKASFLYSWEFKLYITWFFVSLALFPVLQWNFSRPQYDITYKEVIPELVYGIELFAIGTIGIFTHTRFKRLIKQTRGSSNAQTVLEKITYFSELNQLLTVMLLISGSAFIILSTDHLTESRYLNVHKFSADLLICIANFTVVNAWFVMVLIFHPNQDYGERNTTHDPHSSFLFNHNRTSPSAINTNSANVLRSQDAAILESTIGTVLPDKMEGAKPMRPITPHSVSTAPSTRYTRDTDSPYHMHRKNSEQVSMSSASTPGQAYFSDTQPFVKDASMDIPVRKDLRPTLSQAAGVRFDDAKKYRNGEMIEMTDNVVYRQAEEWEHEAAARLGRNESPNTWLRQAPKAPAENF
ncbi:unnamed protein product [Umbelopsis ramanniana]